MDTTAENAQMRHLEPTKDSGLLKGEREGRTSGTSHIRMFIMGDSELRMKNTTRNGMLEEV